MVIEFSLKKVKGERYIKLDKVYEKSISTKDVDIDITGLFPDPEVTKAVISAMKEVLPQMGSGFIPQLRPMWEPFVKEILTGIFERIPFKRIFSSE